MAPCQSGHAHTDACHRDGFAQHAADVQLSLNIAHFLLAAGACSGAVALVGAFRRLILYTVRIGHLLTDGLQRLANLFSSTHDN